MEKIDTSEHPMDTVLEHTIVLEHNKKKKVAKSFLNYAGIFVGIFILFAVIVIMTTDIRLITKETLLEHGLSFFLLLFCAYAMYVNSSDSGMRSGRRSERYTNAVDDYEAQKKEVIDSKQQDRLYEFCRYYSDTELKNARLRMLAVVGFSYENYVKNWLGVEAKNIKESPDLTKAQKKAIIRANSIEPIKLTPEMIMRRGRGSPRREPLGTRPETKKHINFIMKFFTTFVVSTFVSVMVLEVVAKPTWALFAEIVLKVLAVIINGFTGYKFGFENISYDTANYVTDQKDLMKQAMQFFEEHPEEYLEQENPNLDKNTIEKIGTVAA